MLEIKSFSGDWKEATKEQAEDFYKIYRKGSVVIEGADEELKYFNAHHIRGGHVLLSGKIETTYEQKERMFYHYKKYIAKNSININEIRFGVIEYVCSFPQIDPYEMAASLIQSGYTILYDDSAISASENKRKEKHVNKLIYRAKESIDHE